MNSRFPQWVRYGAFVLALVAGLVNAVGLLGFEHQSISHLSGIATLLGSGMLTSSIFNLIHLFAILFSFLLGATISGYLLHGSSLKLGRNYSRALLIEALFILVAMYLLTKENMFGHYLAAAACGLQNALATTYSGAVIRTTHVTGLFTDLGIMLGSRLNGEAIDHRKAYLFVLIIVGFVVGGFAGAILFKAFEFYALFFPAMTCVVLALLYGRYANKVLV